MNKKEMYAMESELRERLMKERWQKTAEQEMKYAIKIPLEDGGWLYVTETKEDGRRDIATYNTYAEAKGVNFNVWGGSGKVVEFKESKPELPHASNKEIADEKVGKWLSAALEDPTTCGAMKDDINEWFRAIEEERLRTKKKSIHDELYDAVKMEMFKASSALEGIEYEGIEVQCKTHPDAPHGFDRNASLSLNRYVCECENWEPEEVLVEGWNIENLKELQLLLKGMIKRMDRIEHGDEYLP